MNAFLIVVDVLLNLLVKDSKYEKYSLPLLKKGIISDPKIKLLPNASYLYILNIKAILCINLYLNF